MYEETNVSSTWDKTIYMYMYMYVCIYVCLDIHTHIYMHTYLHIYTQEKRASVRWDRHETRQDHIYVYVYIHIHTHTYIHTYIQTYTHRRRAAASVRRDRPEPVMRQDRTMSTDEAYEIWNQTYIVRCYQGITHTAHACTCMYEPCLHMKKLRKTFHSHEAYEIWNQTYVVCCYQGLAHARRLRACVHTCINMALEPNHSMLLSRYTIQMPCMLICTYIHRTCVHMRTRYQGAQNA